MASIQPEHRVEKQQVEVLRRHLWQKGLRMGLDADDNIPIFSNETPVGSLTWDVGLRAWRMELKGPVLHCWADVDNAVNEYHRLGQLLRDLSNAWAAYKEKRLPGVFEKYRGVFWEFFSRATTPTQGTP